MGEKCREIFIIVKILFGIIIVWGVVFGWKFDLRNLNIF